MIIYRVKHFVLFLFAILYKGHFSHLKFPDFALILFSSHKKQSLLPAWIFSDEACTADIRVFRFNLQLF